MKIVSDLAPDLEVVSGIDAEVAAGRDGTDPRKETETAEDAGRARGTETARGRTRKRSTENRVRTQPFNLKIKSDID